MTFRPRPKQEEVLAYRGGKMGIAAVPGSGKTVTLSCLAAKLVAEGGLEDDQEVLIVTLVNSAVDHFARQVAGFVRAGGLLPNLGYRVCTLHSLAHDIVRERPGLVGLAEDFAIVDEPEAERLIRDVVASWLRTHPFLADDYLAPDLTEPQRKAIQREHWPRLMEEVAGATIRRAKDLQLGPEQLRDLIEAYGQPLPLLQAASDIYSDYQRSLAYRGAVDFDDLVRLALDALQLDADLLARLRHRWPYVLEDEAQDSTRLQEVLLRLLVGPVGNWVRVGDPNQAIYDTFTTADPRYLREFLQEPGVQRRELPNSGRSTPSIIRLANYLMDWCRHQHPVQELRAALAPPHIEPTPPGDSQPNPPDAPERIFLSTQLRTPREERQMVARNLARFLAEEPNATVAALVCTNEYGARLVAELRRLQVPCVELLTSTTATRDAARLLAAAVAHLADPLSPPKLAGLYRAWHERIHADDDGDADRPARMIGRCPRPEDFLHGRPGTDWLDQALLGLEGAVRERLEEFRAMVASWQEAVVLPPDQLILTLAQDLFHDPADLAMAHKLAVHLRRMDQATPGRHLPDLCRELSAIAANQRKLLGLSEDDTGFDPERHRGKVVVTTVHKAKGLEWDRVYLLSVNNYDFPSAQVHDSYKSERQFVRHHLNLQAEAEAQLEQVTGYRGQVTGCEAQGVKVGEQWSPGEGDPSVTNNLSPVTCNLSPVTCNLSPATYVEGEASRAARIRYCAERLRLLYVGITRARKELVVTCNSGRNGNMRPAAPLVALHTWWEENGRGPTA
ncbi:MAG: DEAD/DEAH box helicase [Anaerolineae bacterium]|nr:DEAD/DEAH box helicase [Anaerolineae bacterium]